MEFSNKVVLITGASAGLGQACALRFAKLGAKLSLVGRNVENLKKVALQCETLNGLKPQMIIADLTSDEDVYRIVNETIKHHEKIDVLVNNAGMLIFAKIYDDIAAFDKMMATNVRGPYLLTQQVVPHLLKTKGNIVNVSSVVSENIVPMLLPYSMGKAALDMFTKNLALDLGPSGVRVNSVNPGPIRTNIFPLSEEALNKSFENVTANIALKRTPESEDIAVVVTFLASDSAKSITGCCHFVDCGLKLGVPADIRLE